MSQRLNFFGHYCRAHELQELLPPVLSEIIGARMFLWMPMSHTILLLTLASNRCECELLSTAFKRAQFLWHFLTDRLSTPPANFFRHPRLILDSYLSRKDPPCRSPRNYYSNLSALHAPLLQADSAHPSHYQSHNHSSPDSHSESTPL